MSVHNYNKIPIIHECQVPMKHSNFTLDGQKESQVCGILVDIASIKPS